MNLVTLIRCSRWKFKMGPSRGQINSWILDRTVVKINLGRPSHCVPTETFLVPLSKHLCSGLPKFLKPQSALSLHCIFATLTSLRFPCYSLLRLPHLPDPIQMDPLLGRPPQLFQGKADHSSTSGTPPQCTVIACPTGQRLYRFHTDRAQSLAHSPHAERVCWMNEWMSCTNQWFGHIQHLWYSQWYS